MLMRIVPPAKNNKKRLPLPIPLAGAGPSAADLILEDRDAPRLSGAVGRELLPQEVVGRERLEAWDSEEEYRAARGRGNGR